MLTPDRWKELLDGVREELGEGKIRGVQWRRRLELRSAAGVAGLWIGGGHDDETFVNCVFLSVHTSQRLPMDLVVSTHWPFFSSPWNPMPTGDPCFDAALKVWVKKRGHPRSPISGAARVALVDLAKAHEGAHLYGEGREVRVVRPGTNIGQPKLASFVLKAVAGVEAILAGP